MPRYSLFFLLPWVALFFAFDAISMLAIMPSLGSNRIARRAQVSIITPPINLLATRKSIRARHTCAPKKGTSSDFRTRVELEYCNEQLRKKKERRYFERLLAKDSLTKLQIGGKK